jgi:hypothetical protein
VHDWHCQADEWKFFRNALRSCGGTAMSFDEIPERYIDRSFCPWGSYLLNCTENCPQASPKNTNGSYLIQFFPNATKLEEGLAYFEVQRVFGGNVTGEAPGYGPFGTTLVVRHTTIHSPCSLHLDMGVCALCDRGIP